MLQMQRKIDSKIGKLFLVASPQGLQGVFWSQRDIPFQLPEKNEKIISILDAAQKQITEYLSGARQEFKITLDIQGTDFQKMVWQKLTKIPYGQTISYKDLAIQLNNQKACRAVGTANGKNPLSLIVPCHRVISSDGTLGGYAGGLAIKKQLLGLEGAWHK